MSEQDGAKPKPMAMTEMNWQQRGLVGHTNAAARDLMERSALVFFDGVNDDFCASGLFVAHEGRHFIATARHVFDQLCRNKDARIAWAPAGAEVDYKDVKFVDVAFSWATTDPEVDVAAILLKPGMDKVFASALFVDTAALSPDTVPDPDLVNGMTWLVGSPQAFRDRKRVEKALPELQGIVQLSTHVRLPCAGQHIEAGREPSLDIHADWSYAFERTTGGPYERLFKAGGLSGSPLWVDPTTVRDVWSADKLRVAGIAWWEDRTTKCIRVVPMGLWLQAAGRALREET